MDDFREINQILGERQQPVSSSSRDDMHARDVSNVTLAVTRALSDKGQQRLCRALEPEYRVYIEFLFHSDNLGRQDIVDDLAHSRTQCPNLDILSESHWKDRLSSKTKKGG